MKIHGKVIEKKRVREVSVTIDGEEHTFTLGAVPISFSVVLNEVLPPPVPPTEKKAARDKDGRPERHPVTGKFYKRELTDDLAYRQALARHGVLVMIYTLFVSLQSGAPGQIEFDIERDYDDRPHDRAFVLGLERELSLVGFESNDLIRICMDAHSLNSFGSIEEVVKSDFSSSSPEAVRTTEKLSDSCEIRDMEEASSTGSCEPANSSPSIPGNSTESPTNGDGDSSPTR